MNTFEQHLQKPSDEWHIASLIVSVKPDFLPSVQQVFNNHNNASVEAADDKGKLVVVIEADSTQSLAQITDEIRLTEHVIDSQLVYHQIADKNTLHQEIDDLEITTTSVEQL
ncbi:Chaperone NapD [Sinobacterium norvegicum]|uniref:Chaperone NapD n=1 Tax=Sinobacterium norvegicum TaxID=1641715 RepID=A0ABM9AE59_9GAMM|nr:chaperone NapD [Sinobacterium norvegicum]CAH0991491.1 Chaperone NapD [Sinobacterium norvegicum]